ncbi:MAG: DUF4199 domain-containing protein [Chitinophagales bacterium]|nr:DUF4199 domain-containing protein [Chitinophagales bacterium]
MSRELVNGIITGFVTLGWMLLVTSLSWDDTEAGKYASLVSLAFLIAGIYITILKKRDTEKNGVISFKEAWYAGMAVSFVVGLMIGIYMAIYVKYIYPNFINDQIKEAMEYYKTEKYSQEQIDKGIESIKALYSGFGQLTYGIGTTMLSGMLISIICAAIMKRSMKSPSNVQI